MHRTLRILAILIATSLTAAFGAPQNTVPPPQNTTPAPQNTAPAAQNATPATQNPSPTPPVVVTPTSIRFAVMGDTGTGEAPQLAVAKQMVAEHDRSPFSFVLMLGDNIYGGNWPKRHKLVFEDPYRPLLDRNVVFYATLGNHDQASANEQMKYPLFNMDGDSKYSFKPAGELVEFFTFDSTPLSDRGDVSQLEWLDKSLEASTATWKIVFAHHPPYSPGTRHKDDAVLVAKLVPILERHRVRVYLSGHEHFFASMKDVEGVHYLISGSAGKIHLGGINPKDPRMEYGNDRLHQFLSVTLTADAFNYSVIDLSGKVLWTSSIPRLQSAAAGGTRR